MTVIEMDLVASRFTTKSDKIRALANAGSTKGEIAKYLGIRYQFVYNVLKARPPSSSVTETSGDESIQEDDAPLTIGDAKRRLARTLGVDPSNVRITIEG